MDDYFKKLISNIDFIQLLTKINNREIVIWGASQLGEVFYKYINQYDLKISAFVDKSKSKTNFCEIEIKSTEYLKDSVKKYYVLIAANYHKEIVNELEKYGYTNNNDYLYMFMPSKIVLENEMNYTDLRGNVIKGKFANHKNGTVNFYGVNNCLIIGKGCKIESGEFNFYNNGNITLRDNVEIGEKFTINIRDSSLYINSNTSLGPCGRIWITSGSSKIGNNCSIERNYDIGIYKGNLVINDNCSSNINLRIHSGEDGDIEIGRDCMLSDYISIFNNDSHPIFDVVDKKLINKSRNVTIGEHVWIGIKSTILPGSKIGNGSIIGANSLVKSNVPNNCIVAGVPATIIKKNIAWDREVKDAKLIQEKKYWNSTKEINNQNEI